MCGTTEYLAPEILLGKGHDRAVDYWNIGALIYEMLTGNTPHANDDKAQLLKDIV